MPDVPVWGGQPNARRRAPARLAVALGACLLSLLAVQPGGADSPHSWIVGPGDSIQRAVDSARRGDTIVVFGAHRENVVVGKDGLTLRGVDAVLRPPATPAANACFDPTVIGESVKGICVSGDIVDFETGEVSRYVDGVTVSGFAVRGFDGGGIFVAAARDTVIEANDVTRNGEAGISVLQAPRTRVRLNHASDTDRSAFFVFRSPGTTLVGNEARTSRFGMQIADSPAVSVLGNAVDGNCVGVLVSGAAGPGRELVVAANRIHHNTRACGAVEDIPALSGAGVVLFGAAHTNVVDNVITANVASGETVVRGGVAVVTGAGAPTGNLVARNTVLRNDPDLVSDGTGSGNIFVDNRCRTSTPPGLCG